VEQNYTSTQSLPQRYIEVCGGIQAPAALTPVYGTNTLTSKRRSLQELL